MTTIRIKLRKSLLSDKPCSVYYLIIHDRQSVQLTSTVKLHSHEWDKRRNCVLIAGEDTDFLLSAQRKIDCELATLQKIISRLEISGNPYSPADIAWEFRSPGVGGKDFFGYMEEKIYHLQQSDNVGTWQNYGRAYRSFSTFLGQGSLPFSHCTTTLISSYELWLRQKGVKRNSISFYMRVLRAVYNSAIADGLAPETNPFKCVYTGVDITRKRAIDIQIIKQLKELNLDNCKPLSYARDLFLFSLYLRGMAFVDMAFLSKQDVQHGVVTYIRRKTGTMLSIKVEPCLQEIMDRYKPQTVSSPYILPIIRKGGNENSAYRQYQSALAYYNRQLKQLSALAGCEVPLSSYMARHTWATAAHNNHIPLSVISAGMGHSSESTTQIYLASLDNSEIDKANRDVIAMFK